MLFSDVDNTYLEFYPLQKNWSLLYEKEYTASRKRAIEFDEK
jgi:hypothetical protein